MTAPTPPNKTNRIRSVTIEGFRSLKNIQGLELPQLTVLIGANGAGKSTLIRFFEMLSWMLKAKNLQEFVLRHGGGDDQFFMGARKTPRIHAEIRMDTEKGQNDYRFDLTHLSAGDTVMVMNEAYRFSAHDIPTKAPWTEIAAVGRESSLLEKKHKTAQTIVSLLRQCSTYQFHDTSINAAIHNRWDVTESFRLRSDGGNLAAVLLDLRNSDHKRYELIVKQIGRVLPTFKDFVLEEESGKVLLRWVGRQSDKVFGSHLTSDGSLRLFCLLTLLSLPPERLLCVQADAPAARLWAAEQALRCAEVAAVGLAAWHAREPDRAVELAIGTYKLNPRTTARFRRWRWRFSPLVLLLTFALADELAQLCLHALLDGAPRPLAGWYRAGWHVSIALSLGWPAALAWATWACATSAKCMDSCPSSRPASMSS